VTLFRKILTANGTSSTRIAIRKDKNQ